MSVEQVICGACGGRGGYTLGPYPATKCNRCNGKGYVIVEAKAAANPDSALRQALVAAEKATREIMNFPPDQDGKGVISSYGVGYAFSHVQAIAREAHALIIEALKDKL